jgi:hypothetical protein
MSEAALQEAVIECARLLNWMAYHTHDSRRSERGFPDLCLARARDGRVLFAELKVGRNKASVAQELWLRTLGAGEVEVYLWYERDWLSGEIERTLK